MLTPAGKLSSAAQTHEALHHFRRLQDPCARRCFARPGWDAEGPQRATPSLAEEIENHPEFVDFLRHFNESQLAD